MHQLFAVLLAAVLVTGCANQAQETVRSRLGALVGAPEQDLARRLGEPTRVYEADGRKFVAYYKYWPDFVYGFRPIDAPVYGASNLIDRFCETTFLVAQGRVAGFTLRGSSCGWGGYPVIAPA